MRRSDRPRGAAIGPLVEILTTTHLYTGGFGARFAAHLRCGHTINIDDRTTYKARCWKCKKGLPLDVDATP